jgi:hypothetical protein
VSVTETAVSERGESLLGLLNDPEVTPARRVAPSHPKGWEPGAHVIGRDGTVTIATATPQEPQWDDVLAVFGLDPKRYQVEEPVEFRAWDAAVGNGEVRRMFYWRIRVHTRISLADNVDVDQLIEVIRKHKPAKKAPPPGDSDFWAFLSDWQIGKEGTSFTLDRLALLPHQIRDRVTSLRRIGHGIGTIHLTGMGDIVERCYGSYPMQLYTTELNHREQRKVARRIILSLVKAVAPLAEHVVVEAIPGNHGEERSDGASVTDFGDNMDTEVFEHVADIVAENPDVYGNVRFVIPRTELTLTLSSADRIVALAHGHQMSGGNAEKAVEDWWKGQQHGRRPAGDADILITAHRHHWASKQNGPRAWFQCPSNDWRSQWFEERMGTPTVPGTLTLLTVPGSDRGWDELSIL